MMNHKRNYFVLGSVITFFVIGGVTLYAKTNDDVGARLLEDDAISASVDDGVTSESEVLLAHDATDDNGGLRVKRGDDEGDADEVRGGDDEDEGDEEEDEWEDDDDEEDDSDVQSGITPTVVSTQTAKSATPTPTPAPTPTPSPTPPTTSGKTFTMAVIATHSTKSSCYTTISGKVYDITTYIDLHPGGVAQIMSICGKDGSSLFSAQHGGDPKPERSLASRLIGTLAL